VPSAVVVRTIIGLILAFAWEPVRVLNGADWSWQAIGWRALVAVAVLAVVSWASPRRQRWLVAVWGGLLAAVIGCWLDLRQPRTPFAWMATTGLLAALLALESAFFCYVREKRGRAAWLSYGAGVSLLALVGGFALGLLAQIESQFAEEEFFVPVQIAFLVVYVLLLLLAQVAARRFVNECERPCVMCRPVIGIGGALVSILALAWWGAHAYQRSFFSPTAPGYQGIALDSPFLCGSAELVPGAPSGEQVFEGIVESVARNPEKDAADYGMLALVSGERSWADAFRTAILAEVEAGAFTEPANSVKYGQRLAARRAYYFPLVSATFPDLFSSSEVALVSDWFAAINRRATTVEWVDLLYGLAFSVWPGGPYENQETGAGLLALLQASGLGDSALAETNRDYLARDVRGWVQRFRNTDDAYAYQAEWMDNASFQEIYQGPGPDVDVFERNRRLAFEWLLLQALPGGGTLGYNRPGKTPLTNVWYWGALILGDPRYLWLADRSLDNPDTSAMPLHAQPGLERSTELAGSAPTEGSCLLFSPTGLPTQLGPLAPDKVVFRDGWTDDAAYLLLNLRFTGWHRYKATNGITLLYQSEPLIVEDTSGETTSWLPVGRSHFRDKRIPRENLNGFLIPRSGFSQVVFALTGMGGPWAQDPPHHVRVDDFSALDALDASRTSIEDWRGWRHQRSIYFLHGGPIIVVDEARGPGGDTSAITWHAPQMDETGVAGVWLRSGEAPVYLAMAGNAWSDIEIKRPAAHDSDATVEMVYHSPTDGELDAVTALLMNGWDGAASELHAIEQDGEVAGQWVRLDTGAEEMRLLHRAFSWESQEDQTGVLSSQGLATDGLALLALGVDSERPSRLCMIRGTQASLASTDEPARLRASEDGTELARGSQWLWEAGTVTIEFSAPTSACYEITY
jgi:hypothetical protein